MRRLASLADLGVTAIELMPVADFAGARNWGYDGVDLFAPARCYGTPDDLRRLVDAAHALGLAVFLDVVYNHLGPEGNYLAKFSPYYFSCQHRTPWGDERRRAEEFRRVGRRHRRISRGHSGLFRRGDAARPMSRQPSCARSMTPFSSAPTRIARLET
jgi:glycosidase